MRQPTRRCRVVFEKPWHTPAASPDMCVSPIWLEPCFLSLCCCHKELWVARVAVRHPGAGRWRRPLLRALYSGNNRQN